jgi:hypothetical protein
MKKIFLILFLILAIPMIAHAQLNGVTSSGCTTCTNGIAIAINGDTILQGKLTIAAGSGGAQISNFLTGSATLDFASAAATVCSADLTITVTGATAGSTCMVGAPNGSVNAGSQFTCWVSAANTVSVRHCNISAAPNDPASGTFKVTVIQ